MTKFALFGAGGVGAYHLAAIERQERKGAARLVAVADPTADRMPERKAQLQGRGVRWHMDYLDLLREEAELDAVVVATPIPFHYEMAKACIERGVFVHLEKPPVPLVHQLETLIRADEMQRVSVGFQMIGSRCIQALKELIVEGRIGELREIRAGGCWPRTDGYYNRASWAGRLMLDGKPVLDGPATNALAHVIHSLHYLAGEGRDEFAVAEEVSGELYRARRIESYDAACMRGRFASRILFSVAVAHATEAALPFQLSVRGTDGWARLSNDGAVLEATCGTELHEPETTQELIDRDYDQLIEVIEGRRERFATCLEDTRGYVSATNGMFVSSGGIHDIDPSAARTWQGEDGLGFNVANLRDAVEESLLAGTLFSEQGLSWAIASPIIVPLDSPDLGRRLLEIIDPNESESSPSAAAVTALP